MSSRDLSALLKVSTALVSSADLATLLQTAIESAVDVLSLDSGAIYLLENETLLLGATTPPLPANFPEDLRRAPLEQHPHITEAVTTGRHVLLRDLSKEALSAEEREVARARGLVSMIYVPLKVEDRVLGIALMGTSTEIREFSESDTELSRILAHQISLAIANAQLVESLKQANDNLALAYDATLEGWSAALEMRDEQTKGHTVRVAELAARLAGRMGISEPDVRNVRRGALLHDIGKMVIPDAILNKPGPLTDEERVVMRKHPEYAHWFLEQVEHLLPSMDIPYCHHERWDGSGYPRGLAGEEIPLSARVFSVLDVFEALTSNRPYRCAWTREDAIAYIREQSGKRFDPAVVEAFILEIAE